MALWISIQLTNYLSLFTCSPCSLVLEDLNEALWISIHLIKYLSLFTCSLVLDDIEAFWISIHLINYLSLVICSVDLSDFEWIFLILYSIMKFLIFSSSFGSGQILCNKFLNPPNWYTLDCIDFLCKFGQFSCTFPIKHTGWVCSHGFCSCKSAGQIFEMGEHEKRARKLPKPSTSYGIFS